MSQDLLNKISCDVGTLIGEVKGINKRLDVSNGRIEKNEERIDTLNTFKDNLVGKISVIIIVVNVVIMFLGSYVKDILAKFI